MRENFVSDIKIDTKKIKIHKQKENFLREIEANPDMLNFLSTKRLKKLNDYYKEIIRENEKKLKNLNKK